jgi:hypothetical protein
MTDKFIETLIAKLNSECENRELPSRKEWTQQDVNLDITKCRQHCQIDTGYVWNGIKLCDSCNKTLHAELDRFNKTTQELALENLNLENKINILINSIENLKTEMKSLHTDNINLKNTITNLEKDNININIILDDTKYNMINSENNIESMLKEYEYKYKNKMNEMSNRVDDLFDNFNNYMNKPDVRSNQFNNIHDENLNDIITTQVKYQNDILDNNKINKKNNKKIANIKVFDKYRFNNYKNSEYIISVNTTTMGNVKPNYVYQSMNGNVVFKIKSFENNFCPKEFNYPATSILIKPEFIKGYIDLVDMYDEFYCVEINN